nr:hypothetical protein [Tanacetum cinerariifolium]
MSGTIPPIPPPLGTNTCNTSSPNRVDTMPTTNDTINTTTITNVAQNVVDENLPQLLDSKGGYDVINVLEFDKKDFASSHGGPFDIKDTKIAALRLKFNAFKALEGEKVNGTFIRDNDSYVKEDLRSRSEFIADLKAEYHERALLANQKRFYKRSGRAGFARKTMDKSNEIYFACENQEPFQMENLYEVRVKELRRLNPPKEPPEFTSVVIT